MIASPGKVRAVIQLKLTASERKLGSYDLLTAMQFSRRFNRQRNVRQLPATEPYRSWQVCGFARIWLN
ncbi:MAG TPA: hypothetical protein VHC19_25575 [Pirellulales bacterium]|nr:hypothetical protein [Pirellulales bacterium]